MTTNTKQYLFANRVQHVPQSFIREILKVASNPNVVSFAGGLPNPAYFPVKELEQCTANVFRKFGRQALQYAATEGYYPLRQFISARYKDQHQLDIPPEQILITNGSQQALDLIGKLFINTGDKVLVERPSYLGALQCLSVYRPEFAEVTLQPDGIDTNELKLELNRDTVKLLYCIPNFQNPTGARYSSEKRTEIAAILQNHQTILVEDDPYAEISFNREILPPMYSYLPQQTILLGSFSKIVSPGMRLGWMVANPEIIQKATIMKQASDLHTGNLTQYILYEFLSNYNLDQHINTIIAAYKAQKDVMMACLKAYFPHHVRYTEPEGGMFTWLRLPEYITARQLLDEAIKENIIFVPGDTFYASDPDLHTLRLNFSNVDIERMQSSMRIIGNILFEKLE